MSEPTRQRSVLGRSPIALPRSCGIVRGVPRGLRNPIRRSRSLGRASLLGARVFDLAPFRSAVRPVVDRASAVPVDAWLQLVDGSGLGKLP